MPTLPDRIDALERATELAVGRLPSLAIENAQAVVARSRERWTHGTEWTVVALAGATGSGKSSLFNALVGSELSASGVRRPTTAVAHAAVWGQESADRLLEWLDVSRIHRLGSDDPEVDGLVLLDLPDHDSVQKANRLEMERLVALVDLLVWVVDPEKYADAALHNRLAQSLTRHGGAMLFALNQVDRLDQPGRTSCHRDLRHILQERGLSNVPVISTSVRDGTGIGELREAIVERVRSKRAAIVRIQADARAEAERLQGAGGQEPRNHLGRRTGSALCKPSPTPQVLPRSWRLWLPDTGERRARVGWPITRWLAGLRSHPLRRLGLGKGRPSAATSLPRPGRTQLLSLRRSLREAVSSATKDLPAPWPAAVRKAVVGEPTRLVDPLDQAVAGADIAASLSPRWWKFFGVLQTALLVAAVLGGVWLLVLFGFSYLRLPEPPTPEWRGVPFPTLMALGGAGAGIVLGMLGRGLALLGGKRAAARVRREIETRIADVAEDHVFAPLEAEISDFRDFQSALSTAGAAQG